MSATPAPVPDEVLDDLRERLRRFRAVAQVPGSGWTLGTDPGSLAALVRAWVEDFDWRAQEARIAALPWAEPVAGARVLHARPARASGPPVVLLHGWPDSFLRFERVLPLLDDLEVVVPCLPGYPHGPTPSTGTSAAVMAALVDDQLRALGHDRYVVSGGDVGSFVAEALAVTHPDRVAALHLTDVPEHHIEDADVADLDAGLRAFQDAQHDWLMEDGAYALQQATRPWTLAAALGDSPAGLLAWILEKLRGWSDCGGDVEPVFPRDDLLTWATLYWVTGCIGTSFVPYAESGMPAHGRVEVPTAMQLFPKDINPAPRRWAERWFDVRDWAEEPSGGHFAAWERPEAFAAGVRRAVALAR